MNVKIDEITRTAAIQFRNRYQRERENPIISSFAVTLFGIMI